MKHVALLLFLLCSLFISFSASCEISYPDTLSTGVVHNQDRNDFKDRLRFGGNIGASFGSINGFVNISPRVGYALTENTIVGIGLTYYYVWYRQGPINDEHYYGGSVFARQYFLRQLFNNEGALFVHAELEPLSVPDYTRDFEKNGRRIVNTFFLGGGVMLSNFTISALYIINYNSNNSIYADPLQIRVGVLF